MQTPTKHSIHHGGDPGCPRAPGLLYADISCCCSCRWQTGLIGGPAQHEGWAVEGVRMFLGGTIEQSSKLTQTCRSVFTTAC